MQAKIKKISSVILKATLGIATEISYVLASMVAAFIICVLLTRLL